MPELRCPICHAPLLDTTHCTQCGETFEQVDGKPVLVNFADSILQRADYVGTRDWGTFRLDAGSRIGRALQRVIYGDGSDSPTKAAMALFCKELPGKDVLVIGGGSIGHGLEQLFAETSVTGTDIYASPNVAVICDGHHLPFADNSFDGVVIQAVLEHVLDPAQVVAEIHRVLRPAGLAYVETPFMQQVHEAAYDFTRFTHSGHRWLFRWFDQIDAGVRLGSGVSVIWAITYFAKSLGAGPKLSTIAALPFFWTRFFGNRNKGPSLDGASCFYFIGRKALAPLKASDMVGYFAAHR